LISSTNDFKKVSKDYLFSICIPSEFKGNQILKICRDLAGGNDYLDYLEGNGGSSIENIGWLNMHMWTIIVIVVACFMSCICGMSCFYNYRVFRKKSPPFWVPPCCPNCLFPRKRFVPIIEEMNDDEELRDQSDP
jgi:hypothetical protein